MDEPGYAMFCTAV